MLIREHRYISGTLAQPVSTTLRALILFIGHHNIDFEHVSRTFPQVNLLIVPEANSNQQESLQKTASNIKWDLNT